MTHEFVSRGSFVFRFFCSATLSWLRTENPLLVAAENGIRLIRRKFIKPRACCVFTLVARKGAEKENSRTAGSAAAALLLWLTKEAGIEAQGEASNSTINSGFQPPLPLQRKWLNALPSLPPKERSAAKGRENEKTNCEEKQESSRPAASQANNKYNNAQKITSGCLTMVMRTSCATWGSERATFFKCPRSGMQRTGARGPHLNFEPPPAVSQNSGANVCFEWQKDAQNAWLGPETSPRNALNIHGARHKSRWRRLELHSSVLQSFIHFRELVVKIYLTSTQCSSTLEFKIRFQITFQKLLKNLSLVKRDYTKSVYTHLIGPKC